MRYNDTRELDTKGATEGVGLSFQLHSRPAASNNRPKGHCTRIHHGPLRGLEQLPCHRSTTTIRIWNSRRSLLYSGHQNALHSSRLPPSGLLSAFCTSQQTHSHPNSSCSHCAAIPSVFGWLRGALVCSTVVDNSWGTGAWLQIFARLSSRARLVWPETSVLTS